MGILVYFPEEVIALNKELATGLHPQLEEQMRGMYMDEFPEKLGIIAAHCGILLDGDYTSDDIVTLTGVLAEKLVAKRERPRSSMLVLGPTQ